MAASAAVRAGELHRWLRQISHVPADIYIGNSQASSTGGRSAQPGLLIDYIRVFQPVNNYDDMDPVFQ